MKTPDETKARGGPRPGAGRKRVNDDYNTIMTTVRLSEQQKATYDMLGGREWLRDQLDRIAGTKAPEIDVWK